MAQPPVSAIIRLCERVLAANISEQELLRAWPEEPPDPHLAEVRETLFSGLEHSPGTVVNGKWRLNPAWWRKMPEYGEIEAYAEHLRRAETD